MTMSDDTRSIESRPPAGPVLIGVTNAVLSNTGDAAIFEAITVSLRRAFGDTCQIVAFDSNASVTSRLYPEWEIHQQLSVSPPREPARLRNVLQRVRHRLVRLLTDDRRASRLLAAPLVRRSRFARAYRRFEELDVVVSSGGTYLVDHYNFEARVLELRLADVLGKRVILWTQSMGPFESSRAVSQIERIGAVTDAVFFRDDRSARAWSRRVRGSDAEAREVPDAVFALTAPTPTASTAAVEPARRALLSVREWSRGVDASSFDTAAYAASMRSAGALLSSSGWDVRALSTCQGVPSYAYDDSAEAARIFAGVDVDVDREFHSPGGLLSELSSTGLVVTTRMHLAILSLISRVPVIAIAYEFKTLELFANLGLSDFVVKIEDVTPEWMTERIQMLLDEPGRARLSHERLAQLRAEADSPAGHLRRLLQQ